MKELGLTGLPVTHIENASATGLVAFREAAWAVSSGRADVAMALCFDKFTDMAGGGGRGGGRDVIDAPILPASYFALWAQRRMHERGTTAEHFAAIAAKNWNYGAVCPIVAPPARPRRHRRGGAGVADGRRAAHHDDVLPGRRRRRVRDPRPRGPRAGAPARPAARATARVGARSRRRTPAGHTFVGPVVGPATMTRDTARECYEAAGLGPDDVERRVLPRRVRQRGARVLRAARVLRRGRGREARRRGRRPAPAAASRSTPTAGCIARGHPGGPTGLAHDPRVGAAAARRGRRPSGRRRARRARPPRRRRQRLHREPAGSGHLDREDDDTMATERRAARRPARRSRASCGRRPGPRRPGSSPRPSSRPTSSTTCSRPRSG